jgi:hypothetical protein
MKQKVKLQADVFDALELSALVNGGIGRGCLYDESKAAASLDALENEGETVDDIQYVPSCIMGHAMFLDGYRLGFDGECAINPDISPVSAELVRAFPALRATIDDDMLREELADEAAGFTAIVCSIERVNDDYVDAAQKNNKPISWKKWCKIMNVVRGN